MKDIANYGKLLEDVLYYNLKSITYKHVYTENELRKLYGWDASSVDFMIDFDDYINKHRNGKKTIKVWSGR